MIADPTQSMPQIYEDIVKRFSRVDRLSLTKLIMADLPVPYVDESSEWSEEDLREWSASGKQYLAILLEDEEYA